MEKAKRPKVLSGRTERVATGCGNMYVTTDTDGERLFEVFAVLGKAGGCAKCQCEAITRCITVGLRYGVPVAEYIKQLSSLKCPSPGEVTGGEGDKVDRIWSCPDAIARVLGGATDVKSE